MPSPAGKNSELNNHLPGHLSGFRFSQSEIALSEQRLTRDLIKAFCVGWLHMDAGMTLACCSEQIVYSLHIPQTSISFGGTVQGKDEFRRVINEMASSWEHILFRTIGQIAVDGSTARSQSEFIARHKPTNQILDGRVRDVWTVENGLVTRRETHCDAARIDAFLKMAAVTG